MIHYLPFTAFVSRENPRDLLERVASPFFFGPSREGRPDKSSPLVFLEYGFLSSDFKHQLVPFICERDKLKPGF